MGEPNSLSVILPVRNAQQILARKVATLLDFLPELTSQFEILVVDDGSDDHTIEIAHELGRTYPQVSVVKNPQPSGGGGIVETGLAHAAGEILFIQDEGAPIDTMQFRRLWSLRCDDRVAPPSAVRPDMVLSSTQLRTRPSLVKRIVAWGVRLEENERKTGLQMIRRVVPDAGRMTSGQRATLPMRNRVDSSNQMNRQRTANLHPNQA